MESDCRISTKTFACHTLVWCWLFFRILEAAALSKSDNLVTEPMATPCWQVEEFVVSDECFKCSAFQLKSWPACRLTGYIEKVNCTKSNKDEYKSCRSIQTEERLFWKFEGTMLCLAVIFALLVVFRHRTLDRLASEKVRKQIESL